MSALCDGCGNTSADCDPNCPHRKRTTTSHHLQHARLPWRQALRVRLGRLVDALTTLPYAPGEVDPRPVIGGGPRPKQAEPAEPSPEPRRRAHRFDRTRTDLIPVSQLLAAAEAARAAEQPTEPIPLIELPLLSHTGSEQLLAEAHVLNHPTPAAPVPAAPSRFRIAFSGRAPGAGWPGRVRITPIGGPL